MIDDKNFLRAINSLLGVEGGFVDNPNDPGGATKWGITESVARRNGYRGDMRDLSRDQAIEIYFSEYWKKPGIHTIKNGKIAGEIFEFGVNSGMHTAIKVLQRAYNVLNKNDFLVEDGVLGPKTASKINNYKYYKSLYSIMNVLQGMYYIGLAEGDKMLVENIKHHKQAPGTKYKTFIRGWIDKRVKILN